MRYTSPELEGNSLAYRGRRFWVVELAANGSFQGFTEELGEYVVFDRLYNGVAASIRRMDDGRLLVTTTAMFATRGVAGNLKEAVLLADRLAIAEYRGAY